MDRTIAKYDKWRKDIFERDNYTCAKCDKKGGKLVAHHIMSFNIFEYLRFVITNGITMCDGCHKEFHREYGNRYNNMKQLSEFYTLP